MRPCSILLAPSLLAILALPTAAQDWGSGYNMGSIGVTGGDAETGTILIDCAEAGNAVVPQGALTLFLKPATGSKIKSADRLDFAVDGTTVTLPVGADQGDGFVFDKTAETLSQARQLIDLLLTGQQLVVLAAGEPVATIDLAGAAAALSGVEACL